MQHFVAGELVAASRGKNRIEYQRNVGVIRNDLGDRGDVLHAAERADLERIDGHVLEQTARLIGDPLRIDRLHGLDAEGILHRDRGDDGQRVTAHAGERQQIGLDTRAAGRVGSGERQHQRRKIGIVIGRRRHRGIAWGGC